MKTLHPERLLGTVKDRGEWAKLSVYSLEKILSKKCKTKGGHEFAAKILNKFRTYKKVITCSQSLANKLGEISVKNASVEKFYKSNPKESGCFIFNELSLYYSVENKEINMVLFDDDRTTKPLWAVSIDSLEFVDDTIPMNGVFERSISELLFLLLAYRHDPSFIEYNPRPRNTSAIEKQSEETPVSQGFSIPIEYVTLASGRSRIYKALSAQVRGHIRKQRVGPGRLITREVFVKEHTKNYAKNTIRPND